LTGWVADAVLRVLPILVFLTGVTIVAELADRAGVFTSASGLAARAGRGLFVDSGWSSSRWRR
jgi:hypothetical protein